MKNYFQFLALFLLLILIDQLFKFVFQINSTCNKNIGWGIAIPPAIFYFLWIIIFPALLYFFLKSKKSAEKIAFIFILSGAISNIVDRLIYGCVIDFIDLKLWPTFNLADIYITMGIISLIILNFKLKISNQS